MAPHGNPGRDGGPAGSGGSLSSRSRQRQGAPKPSLCGSGGELGTLPGREASGIVLAAALTGGLGFRYGSYLVWKELGGFSEEAVVPLGLYAGQLTLNWAWSPIFFGTRQMGWVSLPAPQIWLVEGGPPSGNMASHPRPGQTLKAGAGWRSAHGQRVLRRPLGTAPSCGASAAALPLVEEPCRACSGLLALGLGAAV